MHDVAPDHRITDEERRARMVVRHHLGGTAFDVTEGLRSLVALHSSDPASPYLSLRARIPGFEIRQLEHELYENRSLWRLHAMRRTLFVVPAGDADVFEAGAARAVARRERRRIEGWLDGAIGGASASEWIDRACGRVLEVLADGSLLTMSELAAAIPELTTEISVGSGRWRAATPVAPRILFLAGLALDVLRTRPVGTWRSSRYRWAAAEPWFGHRPAPLEADEGRRRIARRYLERFGPATLDDIRWWAGWTKGEVRRVLEEVGTVEVRLDDGVGFVLGDDVTPPPVDEPTVTLLPGLDPTPMGWKGRGWYLGEHGGEVFDRNGNAGPTVWVDGRVVGGWGQAGDGRVVVHLLEDVDDDARRLIEVECEQLTEWLEGTVVVPRFRSPLERRLSG